MVSHRAADEDPVARARRRLCEKYELIPATADPRDFELPPGETLGAIHAASALAIADDLAVVVAYDADLAGALEGEGLSVVAPGA